MLVVHSRVGAVKKRGREDNQLEIQYLPYRPVVGERAILLTLAGSLVLSTCAAQLRRHFSEQVASVDDVSAQARWR